jgi:L-ascorbate metabolism protein UlaG (beta-lactamase superfamily)
MLRRTLLVALLLSLTSCSAAFRILGRSFASLGHSPLPVANKVTHPARPDARLAVLWVGHATALVQMDDKFILTDPVFTDSVGQVSRRLVEPGIEPANLPPIDACVISHMHFDHLSVGSLDLVEPKLRQLLVPRGGLVYVPNYRFPVDELGRWQSWSSGALRVTAVPVKHLGFRFGVDAAWMDESFTGWVIEYHGLTVYFGGDTAYDADAFARTAARFPRIDLALLPISPVEPREFMKRTHVDGREAIQAFLDLGAARMVPVHYGTFINSTDEPGDALRVLGDAMRAKGLGEDRVQVLRIGEQRVLIARAAP